MRAPVQVLLDTANRGSATTRAGLGVNTVETIIEVDAFVVS